MNGKGGNESQYRAARRWLLGLGSIAIASAFVRQPPPFATEIQHQQHSRPLHRFANSNTNTARHDSVSIASRKNYLTVVRSSVKTGDSNAEFDALLEETSNFGKAIRFLKSNPDKIDVSRDRFGQIFDAIEERTSDAEVNSGGGGAPDDQQQQQQQNPIISESRKEMSEMYSLLKEQGHLKLFGAITRENMPASGSHTVRPTMLETITSLSMSSLTPQPSNTMTFAGVIAAFAAAGVSEFFGWNLNVVFFACLTAALTDQVVLNGAISESAVKILSPETQPKITRHEAGHFLCSYILGCPVEGYVLSSWDALQDPRFRGMGVSAGTSFFDPSLSSQIENSKISRSSIDRYSIIVMAGIAAEAIFYGRADGGAGDEQALIGFLSNLNGGSSAPAWNDLTIRNQARWGALQSVLILREYKECYDALVDALERNGSLGDCIFAIEDAARKHNKVPLRIPLGYISEEGPNEIWTKVIPNQYAAPIAKKEIANTEESLETLRSYKEEMTIKLRDINEKLNGL